jgi:hypothetical protein
MSSTNRQRQKNSMRKSSTIFRTVITFRKRVKILERFGAIPSIEPERGQKSIH